MRVVLALADPVGGALLEEQLRFHLALGVDAVVLPEAAAAALPPDLRGRTDARIVPVPEAGANLVSRLRMVAIEQGAADWLLETGPGEFWYPRGENLHDALAPIPPRYTIVQALVREFQGGAGGPAGRTTRASLLDPGVSVAAPDAMLRPVIRVLDGTIDPDRGDVPLRAWYPVELLTFPSSPTAPGAFNGTTVTDVRLRDALEAIAADPTGPLTVPVPTVVDDSLYAIECAAVKEVDLVSLDRHIRELERRIAWLEERPLTKVVRGLKRLLRR